MRNKLSIVAGIAFLALGAVGCEGPMGPQGPAGSTGPEGPAGPTGPAGQDVNENCTQCHVSNTELFSKQVQYYTSIHYTGGNFERSTTSCAPCHTHEGFVERIATGAQVTAADIVNPSPQNCRSCHQIHTTYTSADYALTIETPVDLWNASHGQVDFGKGNLCAQCHQARVLSPEPVIGGADVTFTSSRYGYHHGPQGNVLGGTSGFEFTGTATIAGGPSSHGAVAANADGCVTCHMADPFGNQAGDHTWNMVYLYHGGPEDLTAGCEVAGCHASVADFEILGTQADVEAKLDSLGVLLRAIGIVQPAPSEYRVAGTWPADVAAAAVNWQMVIEDRSKGIHNPAYVTALLQNTIEAMEPLVP
jgi:hypothetical protein